MNLEHQPLLQRLEWTAANPTGREELALQARVASTDLIHGESLDKYSRHGIDLRTQALLINRTHLFKNEHVLLAPVQAEYLLAHQFPNLDRLGGVLRSEDRLPMDVALSEGRYLCTSFYDNNDVFSNIIDKAEELFPLDKPNPEVNPDTLYHQVSAFQMLIALNHPFFEANGRTSEDFMYALFKRRPDLSNMTRYLSSDGKRDSDAVVNQTAFINNEARSALLLFGMQMRLNSVEMSKINSINDMIMALVLKRGGDITDHLDAYLQYYADRLWRITARVDDVEYLKKYLTVNAMAENLKNSSPTYTLKNGLVLG